MAQKILGLDIGSHSIKAALFETAFRAYTLTDLFQSPPLKLDEISPDEHDAIISEALHHLIQKNHLQDVNAVTSLSGKFVSNRVLKLPLPPKQIAKVLPFEIESYIPFPLDELIIDHHVIQSGRQETVCLVAAAQKSVIQHHLSLLERSKLEPSFITFDSLALYNLNQFIGNQNFKTYAIIDIGHQKTSVCVIANGKIGMIRTLYSGGYDINESIRAQLNLITDQAVEAKEKHGMIELEGHTVKSTDLRRLSNSIKGVINPLFEEISQSFSLFRTQEWILPDEQRIEHVFFCGGTSLIKNLPEYFTFLTDIPSERLYLLDQNNPERESKQKEPIFASAVATGLKVSARGKNAALIESINFRKGEFSFSKSLGDFQDRIFFLGKWIVAIFIVAFIQLIIKNNYLRHENNSIERVILQEYKKIIPDDKAQNAKAALKKLETKISDLQQKEEVLTSGLDRTTALGILRQLSVIIPEQIATDLKDLTIDKNKITITGETSSFSAVDQIVSSIQSNPEYQRVQKGDTREAPDGKTAFQITILVGEANTPAEKEKPKK